MIMENINSWFNRLESEQKERLRKDFEEFALPKKVM